jgi:hypothetical protein
MNIKLIFAIISSIAGIFCFIPYIRDIFLHKTQPHSYSWFIWMILQTVGAISMFSIGAEWGVLSVGIGAIFCGFIFLLSFKFGTHNIKFIDKVCLIGALFAIVTFFYIHNPFLSVLIVAMTDLIGSFPTMRKAYEEPQTETASTYVFSFISTLLAIFALSNFTIGNSLYLIILVFTNASCALIIIIRRKSKLGF